METKIIESQKRTYTNTGGTPLTFRKSCRHALSLAKSYGVGWEHHVGGIVYVTDDREIVRIDKSGPSQTWSERIVHRFA